MSFEQSFDQFVQAVISGVRTLASSAIGEALDQAESDSKAFMAESEEKLRRWLHALKDGQLSRDEFEFLVASQGDLAKMHALKAVGVTQARLERFRTGLKSLVVNAAFEAFGI